MSAADLALQALKEESVRDLCDCASNENIEDADESLEITQLCDQEEPEHTRQSNNDDTTSMQTDEEPGL